MLAEAVVSSCFENGIRYWGNIASWQYMYRTSVPEDCQEQCATVPNCNYWTYGRGYWYSLCLMYSTKTGQTKVGNNIASGPKSCDNTEEVNCPALPRFMNGVSRIINGQDASAPIPWQVSLQFNGIAGAHWCGGSVLDSKTILTAAHCVDQDIDYSKWVVMAGATNKFLGQKVSFAKVIIHPDYDASTIENDIAVIKLTKPLTLGSDVQAICFPDEEINLEDGAECYTSGWGETLTEKK